MFGNVIFKLWLFKKKYLIKVCSLVKLLELYISLIWNKHFIIDKLYANSSSKNKLGSNKRHEKWVYDLIQKPSCKRKIISNKKFDFSECLNLKKLISKEIEMMNNLKLNSMHIFYHNSKYT